MAFAITVAPNFEQRRVFPSTRVGATDAIVLNRLVRRSSQRWRVAVAAAEDIVALAERLWPALQEIDTSSGALGNAVNHVLKELLPARDSTCAGNPRSVAVA
jgi:hypothetical protein